MSEKPSCSFLATIPPIMTAIKITGGGDGMRIQFDVPESEMGEATTLLLMRGPQVLRVTVEVDDSHTDSW